LQYSNSKAYWRKLKTMAKLSKEELDQIKKLEKNLYNIRSKYGTIGDRLKYVEKQLFDAKEKEIKYLDDQIKQAKTFITGSTAKDINKKIAEYEKTQAEVIAKYHEKLGKVRAKFMEYTERLQKAHTNTLGKIKKLEKPDLLKKASQSFKKIPYKKTAAGVAIGAGALLAAATLKRYRNLEKQRKERISQN